MIKKLQYAFVLGCINIACNAQTDFSTPTPQPTKQSNLKTSLKQQPNSATPHQESRFSMPSLWLDIKDHSFAWLFSTFIVSLIFFFTIFFAALTDWRGIVLSTILSCLLQSVVALLLTSLFSFWSSRNTTLKNLPQPSFADIFWRFTRFMWSSVLLDFGVGLLYVFRFTETYMFPKEDGDILFIKTFIFTPVVMSVMIVIGLIAYAYWYKIGPKDPSLTPPLPSSQQPQDNKTLVLSAPLDQDTPIKTKLHS